MIYAGPKLQQDLFNVLVRFRRNPVGIACDIQEMYLQIEIEEQDRSDCCGGTLTQPTAGRIRVQPCSVWKEFGSYGVAVCRAGERSKKPRSDCYPLAAETVLKSTYMDDSIDSVENDEEVVE